MYSSSGRVYLLLYPPSWHSSDTLIASRAGYIAAITDPKDIGAYCGTSWATTLPRPRSIWGNSMAVLPRLPTAAFVYSALAPMRRFRLGLARRPKPKLKPPSTPEPTPKRSALPDVLWNSLYALRESADAFPPLKSAVGGVLAVWDIAERAQHAKAETRDIALRTKAILDLIADAVPNGSDIPSPLLRSIERFTTKVEEIRRDISPIALSGTFSRFVHLKRNEDMVRNIKAQLDEAYRDLLTASTLRSEVQQARTQSDVRHLYAITETQLFYSRLAVFLASP
ncbi:hypothetical protein B0H11DRAFT_2259292 [Mycena galericulata]|nr:hypothetical protein B0H11DRAFT_2259292 [Mycena galericulata]